ARQEAVGMEFRFRPCARLRVCLRAWRTRPEGGDTGARAGGLQYWGRDRATHFRRRLLAGADMAVARSRRAADPAHRLAGGGGDRHLLAGRTYLCWLSAVVALWRWSFGPGHSMDTLSLFGLFAVTAMLVAYA